MMNDTWILKNARKNAQHEFVWDLHRAGAIYKAGKPYMECFNAVLSVGNDADTYHEEHSDGKHSKTQTVAELRAEDARQQAYIESLG